MNTSTPLQLPEVVGKQAPVPEISVEELSLDEIKRRSIASLEQMTQSLPRGVHLKLISVPRPEVIKKLDPDMLALRKLELTQNLRFNDVPNSYRTTEIDNMLRNAA